MQLLTAIYEAKNGIEVRFDDKPTDQLTDLLSKMGFKYSYRQTMWYAGNTVQRNAFINELNEALEQEVSTDSILIKPAYEASQENIDNRNFSCVCINCLEGGENTVAHEHLLFEPAKRAAEEIAKRFALAAFGEQVKSITVHPRNHKKKARALFEQGKIIYSSVPEVLPEQEIPLAETAVKPQVEVITSQEVDLANVPPHEDIIVSEEVTPAEESTPLAANPYQEVIASHMNQQEAPVATVLASAPQEKTDEDILEELFRMKRVSNLSRSLLRELGIQHPLGTWQITIGNYQLTRTAVFSFTYKLTKLTTYD